MIHPESRWPAAHILVVDDIPENRVLLSEQLDQCGYAVTAVSNGAQALAAAASVPPDLILLDIDMPGMDGYEVCAKLKADPALREIPIIFLSGLGDTNHKIRGFASGGIDYITKPFEAKELEARVSTHLKLHSLQQEVERNNTNLQHLVDEQVKEISESHLATILALSKLAEHRDQETGNHILRVQRYCRALAVKLARLGKLAGADWGFIENLFQASAMHDIGKVGIPDSILLKPMALTPEETAIMKMHSDLGAQTLAEIVAAYPNNTFLKMGAEVAQSHHERWDGTGYPRGLAGENIPISARILMVADVYDALRSARPYKKPIDAAQARAILLEGDGRTMPRHFDPAVLEAFKQISGEFEAIYSEFNEP